MNLGCILDLCVKPAIWELFKSIQIILSTDEDNN